ncbi:hypothetical protein WMY93_034383, partial [Mugilogobius chulae]
DSSSGQGLLVPHRSSCPCFLHRCSRLMKRSTAPDEKLWSHCEKAFKSRFRQEGLVVL